MKTFAAPDLERVYRSRGETDGCGSSVFLGEKGLMVMNSRM